MLRGEWILYCLLLCCELVFVVLWFTVLVRCFECGLVYVVVLCALLLIVLGMSL